MSAATLERPKKAVAAKGRTAEVNDFCRGRDLAIEMLKAGEAQDGRGWTEPLRWVRDGEAQNRFALPFLQRLRAEPELMDGFAAVLSGRLGTGDTVRADSFAIDWAEYQAGPVGADGTLNEPCDTAQMPQAKPAAAQPALSSAPRADKFDADGASLRLAHACSVSSMLSLIFGNGTSVAPSEIRDLDGLMGAVQHLRNILATLHAEVMAVAGDLPSDFRTNVFEASSLATLVDEMEWLGQYTFAMGNEALSDYFSTICAACEKASEAINAPEGAPA
ncbi:MAG: hypothetical protein JSS56_23140 [Proteobacteria bacterium]|nr:hypothetical protein [Pseudomonadota bacterium]